MPKFTYSVQGMHCSSCEVLVERAFKHDPRVSQVKASQPHQVVEVWGHSEPDLAAANERLKSHGYCVQPGVREARSSWARLGGLSLLIVAFYVLLRNFKLAPDIGSSDDLALGVVLVMGLVAAVSSCIAVTGGLLVAISSAHAQAHPELVGWQKFRPHVFFNLGRVAGYTLLGAGVGALGSFIALSPVASGVVTLLASAAMITLGFRLLNVFPWLSRLTFRPPKFIAHKLQDASGSPRAWAPLLMGAATFFLPCGFTQALQLYVLTRGDAGVGAVTMLVFSLGTLPALMGLGAITSFVRGRWQQVVATAAGAVVVALGFINLGYGANLTGLTTALAAARENVRQVGARSAEAVSDPNVEFKDGVQVVKMKVVSRGYEPNRFRLQAGVPVRWEIEGVNVNGCQSILQLPSFGVTKFVGRGMNVVEFTPQAAGILRFNCAMGMYRGSFSVVESGEASGVAAPLGSPVACDPQRMNCVR